ncbi:pyroglutamylated RF-amide peptide receptor, partial [Nematostella vectensis]|uniref:pyroglutamylated RF-amide peptide receptor n=1 Tax=Nematostella vectensis TaxID=45351 RepID=UPI0020778876
SPSVTSFSSCFSARILCLELTLHTLVVSLGIYFVHRLRGSRWHGRGGYASAFSLTIIAIERYYAVVKPTHAKKAFTMRRLKLFVLFCWLLALSWNSVGFAVKRFDQVNINCFMLWPDTVSFKIYSTMSLVVFGLVPGLLMCGLYSKIIYVLWINKLRHNLTCLTTERRFKLHRKKATKMAIVVSLVYLVSWIPELTVFNLIAYKPWLIRDIVTTYQVTVAMVMINSAVNPVIYTLHGQRYRHYLKKLLICLRKKPKQTRDEDTKL